MSGTFDSLGVSDAFMASAAHRSESLRLNKEPFNEKIPRDKSFWSDHGGDMIGLHSILRESSSALRALVEFALSSSARIDAITHVGLSNCGIFGWPHGPSESGFDKRHEPCPAPCPIIVRTLDVEAAFGLFGGFLFCGHRRLYKASEDGYGTVCPEAACGASCEP